jgi:hypothetical protein
MGNDLADEIAQFHARVQGGSYDNFKDLILEARAFHVLLPPGASTERMIVEEILTSATTSAHELALAEPGMADYLDGLIDPSWVRNDGQVIVPMDDIDNASKPTVAKPARTTKKPAAKAKAPAKKPAAKKPAKKPAKRAAKKSAAKTRTKPAAKKSAPKPARKKR